jgi:hypothetical protein
MQSGPMHPCLTMQNIHYSAIIQCPSLKNHIKCLRGTWAMHTANRAEASRGSVKCKCYRKQAPCLAAYCTSNNRLTALLPMHTVMHSQNIDKLRTLASRDTVASDQKREGGWAKRVYVKPQASTYMLWQNTSKRR